MKYAELGYNSFLIRTILIPPTQSPAEARNAIPTGSLSASQFSMPMNPTTTIVFSSTDYNTAAWSAGIIYFANGTQSLAITAGNTGDITATTYIYYSEDKSPVIQTTTTPLVATGSGKFLLAIVELGVSGKDCKITPTIAAGLVVSGLTAKSISVGQLDALAVNTGTLTVDEAINVGGTRIKFDGANNRILVSDANDGRLVFDNDGTFKISNSGQEVLTATGVNLAFYFNPATNSIKKGGYEISTMQELNIPLIMSGASGGGFDSFYTNQHANTQYLWSSRFQIDPDDYPSCTFLLEAVYRAGVGGAEPARTVRMALWDVTADAEITNSPVSGSEQSGADPAGYPRMRGTTNFRGNMTSGSRDYVVTYIKSNNTDAADFIDLYQVRLIIQI